MKEIIKMQRKKILITIPFLILLIVGLNRTIYYNNLLGSCNIVNRWIAVTSIGGVSLGLIIIIIRDSLELYKETVDTEENK